VGGDDLERLAADGARGPQQRNSRHLFQVYERIGRVDQVNARIT
jgi:hypothetical protein